MKLRLEISLAVNVILAALVLWLVHSHTSPLAKLPAAPNESALSETQAIPAPTATAPPETAAATPSPFRWTQLVASDYRVFIQNLRDIGCPENDVRAIVTADSDKAFAFQRSELHLSADGTGPWSWQAEQRFIAKLLGEQIAPATVAQQIPTTGQRPDTAPDLPLIFQPVDIQQLHPTDVQKEVIGQLRQQFLDEIGGTNQDPNDPSYLARWLAAQSTINQITRGRLGSQFYIRMRELAAGHPISPN